MNDDNTKDGEQPLQDPVRHDSLRRAEPLLPGVETNREEVTAGSYSEESPEEYLYDTEDDDDSIDYDVDPESISDQEYDDEDEADADGQPADWQSAPLKPELERHRDYEAEEEDWSGQEESEQDAPWPIGLIIVAAFALLLLAAGGYGVMQQRAAMSEEIRSLQAVIATSASPQEIASSREDQRLLEQRNKELGATIEALQVEIRTLQDTAQGLESQLLQQRSSTASAVKPVAVKPVAVKPVVVKPVAVKPVAVKPVAVKPVAVKPVAVKPVAVKPAPTQAVTGNKPWFVNFGSYRKRETATSWAARLSPASGKVVVLTGQKNGDTFYRVRVVALTSKAQAEGIARILEQKYDLSKLWIGEQ